MQSLFVVAVGLMFSAALIVFGGQAAEAGNWFPEPTPTASNAPYISPWLDAGWKFETGGRLSWSGLSPVFPGDGVPQSLEIHNLSGNITITCPNGWSLTGTIVQSVPCTDFVQLGGGDYTTYYVVPNP